MTPDAKVRFYKAMYQAKTEQYDALMREVDVLLDPSGGAHYTDRTPAPATCACGEIPTSLMAQTGKYLLNRTVHRLGEPCYHSDPS